MPYSIYEQQQQQQQQLIANRLFDDENPYGTTRNQQAIYNENNAEINQTSNQLQNQLQNQSTSRLNGQATQPNGLIMNGQSHNSASNPLLDQMSLLNTMNQQNTLLNSSITIPGATSTLNHPNLIAPSFGPTAILNNLDPNNVRWRDPDLHEVIELINHPNPIIKANAAAYLGHLSFMDDSIKQKARALGSIGALINALNYEIQLLTAQANQQQLTSANQLQTQPSRDVQRNCLGALRNLSFGRQNEDNKKMIKASNGIFTLVSLLKYSINDKELKELITCILWNLSSSEEIKKTIIDEAVKDIVNYIIIPGSGWSGQTTGNENSSYDPVYGAGEVYWAAVFRNSSGVLRNVSSAGEYARCKLRECDGLCESLLFIVRQAISKNDIDNKSIENCVCVLRNLSYRCQEVIDPDYDKHHNSTNENGKLTSALSPSMTRAHALIMGKVSDNLGCFGGSRKKKEFSSANSSNSLSNAGQLNDTHHKSSSTLSNRQNDSKSSINKAGIDHKSSNNTLTNHAGMQLLWQPDVVQIYLALLSECSNPETLEAAAASIQNLCACYWSVSAEIRAAVRKEKGLPVLVELLRMEVDRVVCAVATALRNLALDTRNKELIGKYAMRDLVSKLPSNQQHISSFDASDDTIAAVLATLNEVVSKNADFAKSLLEANGMERLLHIIKFSNKYSSRVVKFTSQLLYNMWQHTDLRETYRKAGYKENNFLVKQLPTGSSNTTTISMNSKNSLNSMSATCSANNTLTRPMSTMSTNNDLTRTLPKGVDFHRNLANGNLNTIQRRPSDELQLNDLSIYNNGIDGLQPNLMQQINPLNPLTAQPLPIPPQLNQSQQASMAAIYQTQSQVHDEINQLNQRTAAMNLYSSGGVNLIRTEALYAKVNREKKKQHLNQDTTASLLQNEEQNGFSNPESQQQTNQQPGDSWV